MTVPEDSVTLTVLVTVTSEPVPAPALLLEDPAGGTVTVALPLLLAPLPGPMGAAIGAKTLAASSGS